MNSKLFVLCFALFAVFSLQAQKLTQVWETEKVLDTPESVFLADGIIYVSNIGGKDGMAKDGNGFISKLSLEGKVIDLKWVDGLDAPKGLFVTDKTVVVSDRDKIVVVDKQTGKIQEEFIIEGATFLNDVIVTTDGQIITTDYKDTKIYSIKDKTISVLVKDERLDHVNGLSYDGSRLLTGCNSKVFKVDIETGEIELWSDAPVWIDGIEPIGNDRILVSDWSAKVVLLQKSEDPKVLIELDTKDYNTADMDFDPLTKRVYIPTFFRNTVICYQYID